jgi:hypothetical protein
MRAKRALVVGGLVVVAACSDSTTNSKEVTGPEANPAVQQSELAPVSVHRIMDLRPSVEAAGDNADNQAKTGAPTANTGIFYHGGPIIVNPAVVAIYWGGGSNAIYLNGPTTGTGTGSADNSLVGKFMSSLGGSGYWAIDNTYYDGSGAHVAKSLTYTGYWVVGTECAAPSSSPTDANMQALIDCGFSHTKISPDASTVYAIFTPSGINLGGGFGSQYCAYHYWYTSGYPGAGVIKYAAMPYDWQYPSGCAVQSTTPNNDPAADTEVNTLAHELEEAASDQQGNAWYDRRGYENADKCAWKFGTTYTTSNGSKANMNFGGHDWLVQQNWKNSGSGGCYLN